MKNPIPNIAQTSAPADLVAGALSSFTAAAIAGIEHEPVTEPKEIHEARHLCEHLRKCRAEKSAADFEFKNHQRRSEEHQRDVDILTNAVDPEASAEWEQQAQRLLLIQQAKERLMKNIDAISRERVKPIDVLLSELSERLRATHVKNLEACRRVMIERLAPFFPQQRLEAVVNFSSLLSEEFQFQAAHPPSYGGVDWENDGNGGVQIRSYDLSALVASYDRLRESLSAAEGRSSELAQRCREL